ncbi:TPA: DUF1642 domain-containing protein [Streptococcus suis]|nr:DUF1642 domain-containing protein [Streptococcus suis]
MNKQEAKQKIHNMAFAKMNAKPDDLKLADVMQVINQIHEPQKVVVPKFVAEYIERCKRSGWHLQKVLSILDDDEEVGDWAYDENDDLIPEKVDLVAQAWLFGCEVEKERLYTVEIPDPNSRYTYRFLSKNDRGVFIDGSCDYCWKGYDSNCLTESEIKQDFEWAWQWAEPVEEE